MTSDWDILSELPSMQEQTIRKVDLWRYLACRSIGLQEFGEVFASEVVAQDPEPYLVGYSMGGRLALHSLIAQPKLWKGATIISAHPGLSTEEERVARRRKDAEWFDLSRSLPSPTSVPRNRPRFLRLVARGARRSPR